jgi:hypothetical protein
MKERDMMSQQNRLIQLSLLGALLLALFAVVYLANKRIGKPGRPKIVKHRVKTKPADALKHWTAERMRDAKGVELPKVDIVDQEK